MESKILNVMFVAADTSGPAYHDLFLPVQYFHKYNLLKCVIVNDLASTLSTNADLISFQRQYVPEILMFLRKAKAAGKVVMTICDDDVWHLPPNNPAKSIYVGDVLARFNAILREVHAVTTSTPSLKREVLNYNKECYVHRNLVVPFYSTFKADGRDINDKETVRIGWHLTPHHHDDYLIIEEAIVKIAEKYPQVKWIFMGYKVPILSVLPPNRWEFYEFVNIDAFYPALANLDFDIGIAPLVDNAFNRGKTHRKFSEYGILKIPSVLSPVLPYIGLAELNCALTPTTNDTKGWVESLSQLIEDTQLQKTISKNAYNWVLDNQAIDTYIKERSAVYYHVYNKVKGTNLVIPGYEDEEPDFIAPERIQNLKSIQEVDNA